MAVCSNPVQTPGVRCLNLADAIYPEQKTQFEPDLDSPVWSGLFRERVHGPGYLNRANIIFHQCLSADARCSVNTGVTAAQFPSTILHPPRSKFSATILHPSSRICATLWGARLSMPVSHFH